MIKFNLRAWATQAAYKPMHHIYVDLGTITCLEMTTLLFEH